MENHLKSLCQSEGAGWGDGGTEAGVQLLRNSRRPGLATFVLQAGLIKEPRRCMGQATGTAKP